LRVNVADIPNLADVQSKNEEKYKKRCNKIYLPASSFQINPETSIDTCMNWTIFYQEIFPIRHKLYRFALRITGSSADAEDVVQEVLEKVWKTTADQSETIQNWEAWCMTLTRNRSLDKNKLQANRRTAPLDTLTDQAGAIISPEKALEEQDMTQRVRMLIRQLPEKQRLVMHLRDIEELSYEEIAKTLDITIDQVKVNLHRARKTVREQLLQMVGAGGLLGCWAVGLLGC
jgi:RNA polymerase sigma factor (sigma-70 family)